MKTLLTDYGRLEKSEFCKTFEVNTILSKMALSWIFDYIYREEEEDFKSTIDFIVEFKEMNTTSFIIDVMPTWEDNLECWGNLDNNKTVFKGKYW